MVMQYMKYQRHGYAKGFDGDCARFIRTGSLFMNRGGSYDSSATTDSGLFAFVQTSAASYWRDGFRAVVCPI